MCKKILMTLLCGLLFTGCNSKQSGSENISEDSNNRRVKIGETFVIRLESNPTTGYSWSLAGFDANVVEKVSNVYEPKKTAANIVGSGGNEIWTFKAIAKGETKLTFQYVRPWEKDVPPIQEETYQIKVE